MKQILYIGKYNGIIGGIGDNKFAPKNSITRQDMMVIHAEQCGAFAEKRLCCALSLY